MQIKILIKNILKNEMRVLPYSEFKRQLLFKCLPCPSPFIHHHLFHLEHT